MPDHSSAPEERFKEQAERLRQFLAAAGVDLKHTTSLQAVARMHGAHDWRSLVAEHRPTTPPANKSEPATDLSKPTNQYAITTTYKGHSGVTIAPTLKLAIHTFAQEARAMIDLFPSEEQFRFVGQDIDMGLPVLSLMWRSTSLVALSHPMTVDGMRVVKRADGLKLAPAKLPNLYGADECDSFFAIAVAMGDAFSMRTVAESNKRQQQSADSWNSHLCTMDFENEIMDLAIRTQKNFAPPPLDCDPRELLHSIDKIKMSYNAVATISQGD